MSKQKLNLDELANVSLTETEKADTTKAERPYKTIVAMSKKTKIQLAKLKIAKERNVIDILSDIVEKEIGKLAEENNL